MSPGPCPICKWSDGTHNSSCEIQRLRTALDDIAESCEDLARVEDIEDGERHAWRAMAAKARKATAP